MRYYCTLGPACETPELLAELFQKGITGVRLNLSHGGLAGRGHQLSVLQEAARISQYTPEILIDLQGPELRVGTLDAPLSLTENDMVLLGGESFPVPPILLSSLVPRDTLLVDDGRLLLEACSPKEEGWLCRVLRGGILRSRKSIAVTGREIPTPTLTEEDLENLSLAPRWGVTGVMQPFVRGVEDLKILRQALDERGGSQIRIFAKIENLSGVSKLEEFLPLADEIVIARGDLGNCQPLWQLPALQKEIARRCKKAGKPFMVVTQMLASMEQNAVPTRAEVCDIFNAVLDGASSLMLTGETAAGNYPLEAGEYLVRTAREALDYMGMHSI